MLKLIFADDEALVRNNIARLIDWEACGFELVSSASNGDELLEQVEQHQPELVITDINMPFIDGIEAAREIRRSYPQTKIVFLTGYNEVEYVQQALDIKVFKYLLKPITSEKLMMVLIEIKKMLDEERLRHQNSLLLKQFYQQNKPVIQTAFFTKLIQKELSQKEILLKKTSLRLTLLAGNSFQVATLFQDEVAHQGGNGHISPEVLNFSVYNIASEIMAREDLGYALMDGERTTLIFCHHNEHRAERYFPEQLAICLEEIQATIKSYLKCTFSVGIGRNVAQVDKINESYHQAMSAMSYYREMEPESLIFIQDIEPQPHEPMIIDYSQKNTLVEVVKFGSPAEITNLIAELLKTNHQLNLATMRIFVMDILLTLIKEVDVGELDPAVQTQICDLNKVATCQSLAGFQSIMVEACLVTAETLREKRQDARAESLNAAIQLIQREYANPELSIRMICQEIHISESYFRALFKKEFDLTFGNYLTKLRMDKARNLVLKTELKNYQIAEKIGYTDPYYFSYCFKKYYGVPPNKFREQEKG